MLLLSLEIDRGEKMGELLSTFVFGLILWFGTILFLTGLFTVYFGAGKSRMIGLFILFVGLICAAGIVLTRVPGSAPVLGISFFTQVHIAPHILGILGAMVGSVIGLIVFLASLMKA